MFFNNLSGRLTECIWVLCSLSVYPIYYLYIKALTESRPNDYKYYAVLLPGFAVFLIHVFLPSIVADYSRVTLCMMQIIFVCLKGIPMLERYDLLVESNYSDVEGRQMKDVRILLIAFVATSAISALANLLGRTFFASDDRLLLLVASIFTVMLFTLSYIGYNKEFSIKELSDETETTDNESPESSEKEIGKLLDTLMRDEKLYLVNGLKLSDVASRIGSCRTNVSNYINHTKGESFSDYINRQRIDEAKSILGSNAEIKLYLLAEQLGFANEQSFYRNFKKFTGMTPVQWKHTLGQQFSTSGEHISQSGL